MFGDYPVQWNTQTAAEAFLNALRNLWNKLGVEMHPYSTNSEERSRIYFYVAGVAFLLAWLIASLLKDIHSIPFWIGVPGTGNAVRVAARIVSQLSVEMGNVASAGTRESS